MSAIYRYNGTPLNCLAILGPTCSGKTETAFQLAAVLGGEIISCDSMQVYRGMDIGTAKPQPVLRKKIPHHLIDVADIHERYGLHRFLEQAEAAFQSIRARGRLPILAGGTGLYAHAFIYGATPAPADPSVYRRLEKEYDTIPGRDRLNSELRNADPGLYSRIRHNPRRILRALEVLRITGSTAAIHRNTNPRPERRGFLQCILYPDPATHRARIRKRLEEMLNAGWILEVERLRSQGLFETPTARQALGYELIRQYLDGQIPDREELACRLFFATWAYVRRQRAWFRRKHERAYHLVLRPGMGIPQVGSAILSFLTS